MELVLGLELKHVGINSGNADQAMKDATLLCKLLGWQVKEGASPRPSATPGRFFAASGDNAPLRKAVSGFFAEGSVISGISENVTFEAVWEVNSSPDPEPTYRVTYDGNGSTGGSVPVDATAYKDGETVTVREKGDLVKAGSSFVGWNTARNRREYCPDYPCGIRHGRLRSGGLRRDAAQPQETR